MPALCIRCGIVDVKEEGRICKKCNDLENTRAVVNKTRTWVDIAEEAGLQLWERQPEESDREWLLWCAYRDMYPGKRPSISEAARVVGSTYGIAKNASGMWGWQTRLRAWAKEIDTVTAQQRREAMIEMNSRHINMAKELQEKIATAIGALDPGALKPGELKDLLKISSELERTALLHEVKSLSDTIEGENKNATLKRSPTKPDDFNEVVDILMKAGVIKGIRQTTEVVVSDNTDNLQHVRGDEDAE